MKLQITMHTMRACRKLEVYFNAFITRTLH